MHFNLFVLAAFAFLVNAEGPVESASTTTPSTTAPTTNAPAAKGNHGTTATHCGLKELRCMPAVDCTNIEKIKGFRGGKERERWFNQKRLASLLPTTGGYPTGWKCVRCHRAHAPPAKGSNTTPKARKTWVERNALLTKKVTDGKCTLKLRVRTDAEKAARKAKLATQPGRKNKMFRTVGVIADETNKVAILFTRKRTHLKKDAAATDKPAAVSGTPAGAPVPK